MVNTCCYSIHGSKKNNTMVNPELKLYKYFSIYVLNI